MMTQEPAPEWRYAYAALVVAAAAVFLFSIQSVVSPFIAWLVLLLLIAPYAGSRQHTTLVIAATLVLGIWLLETLGTLLAPFVFAFVLAYILDPAVDVLERRGLRRGPAVALLVTPAFLLLALAVALGLPALIQQFDALLMRLPAAAARASHWIVDLRAGVGRVSLPLIPEDVVLGWLSEERVAEFIRARQDAIASRAWNAVAGVGRGVGMAVSILGLVVLTPVLMVYLLRDFDDIARRGAALVPEARRARWLAFLAEYDELLSRFLRGQVIEAALVGVLTWVGLWIAGVPYAGLVGAIAGVFNLVPYLGLVVSIVPVLVIAVLSGSFLSVLLRAGIVFAIVQTIDSTVTGPRIVGGSVGLHPVLIMLALAVGGAFFGLVGLLIAVPAAVLIKLLLREGVSRYRSSALFLEQ